MKRPTKRFWVVLGICAACTLAAVWLEYRGFSQFLEAENYTEDLRTRFGRKTPVDPRLVLIGIDRPLYEASDFGEEVLQSTPILRELQKPFPWSRSVWAYLIEKLSAAGAKVIVFDLIFASPNEGDEALRQVVQSQREKVVAGYSISPQKTDRGDVLQLILPNGNLLPSTNTDTLLQDDRLGFVNIPEDFDGIVRRADFRQTSEQAGFVVSGDVVLESLASRTLKKFGRSDAVPAGFEAVRFRYGNAPGYGYKVHAIGDVLTPKAWEVNYQKGEFFRDKIVLIGPTADVFHDEHNSPFKLPKRQMLGPEIHLNIIASALRGEFMRETSRFAALTMTILSGLLAGGLTFLVRQPVKRLLVVAALGLGYWLLGQVLFDHGQWVIPVAVPLMVLVFSSSVLFSYDFSLERLERMKLRHTMGLYFSPRVLEAVLADPGSMEPRRAEVTLLLTDLRNSTPLAEALGPKGMFDLLNQVFEVQTKAIMSEEGNLEHFLGDQFLSYWGAPQNQPDAADRAARAAQKLIQAMEQIARGLPEPVAILFGYGVALHSGGVLVGNKGSALRLDYGLVGDTVNEAARIEALTKYYGVKLLVSKDTMTQLGNKSVPMRLLDSVIVKGKSEPVELFECENPCTPSNYAELCKRYTAAFDLYFFSHFEQARLKFEALVEEFNDGPSRRMVVRCAELAAAPPRDWNGIWRMESK
ncbi:MAG TPA: adenylate/guanylate cyclase domain-containing protein [Candidatus Saccharimonadales bacterium]|nr:adenylate/guanylate cyclase domain-containing protein [Candidatus Saccharimonadales bacterium]